MKKYLIANHLIAHVKNLALVEKNMANLYNKLDGAYGEKQQAYLELTGNLAAQITEIKLAMVNLIEAIDPTSEKSVR